MCKTFSGSLDILSIFTQKQENALVWNSMEKFGYGIWNYGKVRKHNTRFESSEDSWRLGDWERTTLVSTSSSVATSLDPMTDGKSGEDLNRMSWIECADPEYVPAVRSYPARKKCIELQLKICWSGRLLQGCLCYDGRVMGKLEGGEEVMDVTEKLWKKMMKTSRKWWVLLCCWAVLLLISAKVIRPLSICRLNWAEVVCMLMKNRSLIVDILVWTVE